MNINPFYWSVQDVLDLLFSEAALHEWSSYHFDTWPEDKRQAWVRDCLQIRKALGLTEAEAEVSHLLTRIGLKVYRLNPMAPDAKVFLAQKLIPRAGVPDATERGEEKEHINVKVPVGLLPASMSKTEAVIAGLRLLKMQGTAKLPPRRI